MAKVTSTWEQDKKNGNPTSGRGFFDTHILSMREMPSDVISDLLMGKYLFLQTNKKFYPGTNGKFSFI